ncbi:hypothetical protein JCM33374_g6445 [Metschnikowia sp. JCM 33374]|nr:hypothetical protein JCM33374_g6445 [Metschnikowia sp. JCM 33374]
MSSKPGEVSDFSMYCVEIQRAFADNLGSLKDLVFSTDEIPDDIEYYSSRCRRKLDLSDRPVECEMSIKTTEMKRRLVKELKDTVLQVLLTAPHPELFAKYFPDLPGRQRWEDANKDLAIEIVKNYPFLENKGTLLIAPERKTDLGYVLDAFFEACKENSKFARRHEAEDARVINLLIRHWKGEEIKFLPSIIHLLKIHEYTHGDQPNINSEIQVNISQFTHGFPEEGQRRVDDWFNAKYLNKDTCTPQVEIIKDFHDTVWPKMSPSERYRPRCETSVTAQERIKFSAQIKALGCSQDGFWPVRLAAEFQGGN